MSLIADLPFQLSKHRLGLMHVVFVDRAARGRRPLDLCALPRPVVDGEILPSSDQMAFVRWLFEKVGLDASHYGPQTLRRRIQACLRLLQVNSCAQARRMLESHPSRIHSAISTL